MSTEETLQTIVEYVRRSRPQAAENGSSIPELPVHKVFDSIGMVDFLAFLEQAFQVRISDADVLPENFESFAAVARLVERRRAGGASLSES